MKTNIKIFSILTSPLLYAYALFLAFLPNSAYAAKERLRFSVLPIGDFYEEKIKTGKFHWEDIAFLLLHWIQQLIILSGAVAVVLLMYGGFQYVFGSIIEDKESGKNTIRNTLLGFVVVISSYMIVDYVISFVTS